MKQLLLLLLLIPNILFSQTFEDECTSFVTKSEKEMVGDGYFPRQKSTECNLFKAVVHVINQGEPVGTGTNISDEQIMSSETSTNLSWTNSGHQYHPDNTIFPYEFEITAITRTNGSAVWGNTWTQFGVDGGANESGITPTSIRNYLNSAYDYPTDEYMPIIIYNKRNGSNNTLGFAWIASPDIGVFVKYNQVGDAFYETDTPFIGNPDNSTVLHEIYHALGLFHTFNNATSCTETNCGIQGDRVCDTEPETVSWICGNICGHNSRNYMSYKSCKDVITEGQVSRMESVIAFPPNGILDMLYCPEIEPVFGCIDSLSCNFDPLATQDDGSCVYEVVNCIDCDGELIDSDNDGVCNEEDAFPNEYWPIINDWYVKCDKEGYGAAFWNVENEDNIIGYQVVMYSEPFYEPQELYFMPVGDGSYEFEYQFDVEHYLMVYAVNQNNELKALFKEKQDCLKCGVYVDRRRNVVATEAGVSVLYVYSQTSSVAVDNNNLSSGMYIAVLSNGCRVKFVIQ